jgi:hypothetical protein
MKMKGVHIEKKSRNSGFVPICLRSRGDKAILNGKEVIER